MYMGSYLRVFVTLILILLLTAQVSHSLESDIERVKVLNRKILSLYNQGCYTEAIPIAKDVLAILEKALGPEHPEVAGGLNILAVLYYALGDYAKAEPLYKRALARRRLLVLSILM